MNRSTTKRSATAPSRGQRAGRLTGALLLAAASVFAWGLPARADADVRFAGSELERLPPPSHLRLAQLRERWRSLPPEERRRLREQVRQWRDSAPDERQARREALRRYEMPRRETDEAPPGRDPPHQGLSPEERRQLRRQIIEQEWRGGRRAPFPGPRGR